MGEDDARKLWESSVRHDERLSVLEDNWKDVKTLLQAVQADLSRLSSYNVEVASGLRKAVFGNGSPGLVSDVTQIKATIEARKGVHDKEIARIHGILCWGGLALFGVLIGIIGYLVPMLIKHISGGG